MESTAIGQQLSIASHTLRTGKLQTEADVKAEVIVPILRALGWNPDDTGQVKPEKDAANGKVDYALFHYKQPKVFIEAKRPGKADDPASRKQLLDYTPDRDIPILVLTDGQVWEFYFGLAPGNWEDRRFHRLRLDDHESTSNHADFLTRHLGKEAVVSDSAQYSAHELFVKNQALKHANQALAECWRELLGEPHQDLCNLLGKQVRAKCGVEPHEDDVNRFLTKVATGASWQTHGHRDEPPTDSPIPASHAETPRSRRSRETRPTFSHATLQVLVEMGGGGTLNEVLDQVAKLMEPHLGERDREPNKSGKIRWKHTVAGTLSSLRKQKYLKEDSGNGLWEVSDLGYQRLRDLQ
ncbi:MAG: type I restriction endonuclease [Gammaproteobacteria bacterium]|nr:type I restriction endonuclease [Gammaproteobacteria bacterium]MDE0272400.1 type I restriction endonuclease [Gammaproteobacteria bacterium]